MTEMWRRSILDKYNNNNNNNSFSNLTSIPTFHLGKMGL